MFSELKYFQSQLVLAKKHALLDNFLSIEADTMRQSLTCNMQNKMKLL